jgi:large subunit ribosomal protein L4
LVLEDFNLETPKTKDYVTVLSNLKIDGKKSLVVLNESNKNIYLSSRNLSGTRVVTVSELTTYDILNSTSLVFFESSLDNFQKSL